MQTNPLAKRILLYGDSLVYGKIPWWWPRYASDIRFPWVLQNILGGDYEVIEEGQRGRMLSRQNSYFPHRNGLEQFGPIFSSHAPIDLLVIFLWTNDCNSWSEKNYDDIASALDSYQEKVQRRCQHFWLDIPQLLLIIPPHTKEEYSYHLFKDIFKWGDEKITQLRKDMIQYAQEKNINYFDAAEHVQASENDGIHLDEENNKLLAQAVAEKIQKIIHH